MSKGMVVVIGSNATRIDNRPDFEPYLIENRKLITGQNPRSDHPIAKAPIAALDRKLGLA